MGPPNSMAPPSNTKKNNKGLQRDTSVRPQQLRTTPREKTSLEILLESNDRTPTFANAQQFGLLRDSLVFNHERILQQSPTINQQGTLPSRQATQAHNPSLNTINSQTNNYMESPTPIAIVQQNEEYDTSQELFTRSDRVAQNRANANLDRHVGWQQQAQQVPPGVRNRSGTDFALTRTETQYDDTSGGDIPLTNTAASLHLPSPPTSEIFRGEMEPPSTTTVTTVYAYKCDRSNRHVGDESIVSPTDNFTNPVYEERTQEMPYPYGTVGAQQYHQQMRLDNTTPDLRASEEEMEIGPQREDNSAHEVDVNSTNLQTATAPITAGDYATDEDFDDDLMTLTNHQQPPVFPNVADLKWPDPAFLRATLDPKYHPFLDANSKKDCRSWLWKNEKGRKARELLGAVGKTLSKPSLTRYPRIPTNTDDVQNTMKAFNDNDELEDNDTVAVGLQQ